MPTQLSMILTQVKENREAIRDVDSKVSNHMIEMEGRVTKVETQMSLRTKLALAGASFTAALYALVRFLG